MDQSESQPRPRLDQQAALDELERFGRDIQRYRAQREALGDEFETFVQSFKTPPDPSIHQDRPLIGRPTEATLQATPPAPPVSRLPAEPDVPAPAPMEAASVPESVTVAAPVFETPATEISPPAMTAGPDVIAPDVIAPVAGRPRKPTPVAGIAAGAVLLLGGGLLAAFLWNRGPATTPASGPSPDAAATTAPSPVPAAPPATPPPAAAATDPNASEIVTERKVWMRVIADGAKILEREVPAGTTIPLKAEKTIVIRTGDAGAVKLSMRGGRAAVLGREGEVVTRSFTVPPVSAPAGR